MQSANMCTTVMAYHGASKQNCWFLILSLFCAAFLQRFKFFIIVLFFKGIFCFALAWFLFWFWDCTFLVALWVCSVICANGVFCCCDCSMVLCQEQTHSLHSYLAKRIFWIANIVLSVANGRWSSFQDEVNHRVMMM